MLSILSQSVFDKLPYKPLLRIAVIPVLVFLSPVSHYSLHSRGEIFARLQFSGGTHSYHAPFLICDNVLPPLECILGCDFLLSHQFNLILHDSRCFLEDPQGKPLILPGAEDSIQPSTADTLLFEQSLHKGPVPLTLITSIIIQLEVR